MARTALLQNRQDSPIMTSCLQAFQTVKERVISLEPKQADTPYVVTALGSISKAQSMSITSEYEKRKALLKKLRGSCKHLPGGVEMFLADKHAEEENEIK